MYLIEANSPAEAWIKTTKYLLANGKDEGSLVELLNVCIEINAFASSRFDKEFDVKFRKVMGDDRIDYASKITFVKPTISKLDGAFTYNPIEPKWSDSYFGRMINFKNSFNQLENVLKILKEGKNVKRCELIIYDPLTDARNMYKQPCLIFLDIKPRNGKLFLSAFFRSQRVSKSGYADYTALCNLGNFLAEQSNMKLEKVTSMACSCHLTTENGEKKKSIALLKELNEL
jgi:thymidylate synthase